LPLRWATTSKAWSGLSEDHRRAVKFRGGSAGGRPADAASAITQSMKPAGPQTYRWLPAGAAFSTAAGTSLSASPASSKCSVTGRPRGLGQLVEEGGLGRLRAQ
jgi:hypothetical protein